MFSFTQVSMSKFCGLPLDTFAFVKALLSCIASLGAFLGLCDAVAQILLATALLLTLGKAYRELVSWIERRCIFIKSSGSVQAVAPPLPSSPGNSLVANKQVAAAANIAGEVLSMCDDGDATEMPSEADEDLSDGDIEMLYDEDWLSVPGVPGPEVFDISDEIDDEVFNIASEVPSPMGLVLMK
eukprot:TRINITY_DN15996_c0_g1_i4.p1 TRINITY_DN15996_c0_g1~~TRINITY_DN15996_c0_g1_i4.p1  ORF type:complete len:201 (-),score=42.96 TRINITY_DN15996_c0_g1_i4:134-685(-)